MKHIYLKIKTFFIFNSRHNRNFIYTIKPKNRIYILFFGLIVGIFCVQLYIKYDLYQKLKDGTQIEIKVTNQYYTKNEKSVFVTMNDWNGNLFRAVYAGKLKNIIGRKGIVYGKIYNGCNFFQFLKGCRLYHSTLSLKKNEFNLKSYLLSFINASHTNEKISNVYSALFFGFKLNKDVRNSINAFGIAHLIAISGFHLGILSISLYAILFLCYRFFHIKYFSHRNINFDIGFVILIFLFFYLVLIDFQPAFLRAFILAIIVFFMMISGVKILNFIHLMFCILFAIAINPNLIFNIGFILSCSGIFYVYTFFKHVQGNKFILFFLFNLVIFLLMFPIVHIFFPYFTPFQFNSIWISIIFVVFFPIAILVHIIGFGNIFDSLLLKILESDIYMTNFYTPFSVIIVYILFSLLSIRFKKAFYGLIGISLSLILISTSLYIQS